MPLILNGTTGISGVDGSAGTPSYVGADTDTGVLFPAANTLALSTGGTERVRVDSAGRLIVGGTSAVQGARIESVGNTSGDALALRGRSADDYSNLLFIANAAGTEYARISAFNTSALTFGTGSSGTERMRIDSSGNVLIGNSTDALGGNRLLVQSAATANNNRTFSVYNTAATSTTAFANRIVQISSLGSGADATIHFSDQVANNAYFGMGSGALYFATGGTTERGRFTSGGYFKASNNGTYNNASGSYHEFYNSGNTETLIVRNANASFNQESLIVSADRNTTNNSYYFLRLNVPGVANRLLVADSGSISTAGSVQLGDAGAPPTSGVGIKFPATQSASSDANTLDDYEEGTFSPTIAGLTTEGTASYSTQHGQYTKIGDRVFIIIRLGWSGGTGAGTMIIKGLPFTQLNGFGDIPYAVSEWSDIAWSANYSPTPVGQQNGTYIYLNQSRIGGSGSAANTTYDAAGFISITGHYKIN